ncbi:GTPase HflX [Egibacter rhizosphaerae]|uniref:GTPase HflX n=1 Tax=Egibacter rhizosphaerae TaxID=1670831 RepID=UPI0013F16050|nr:GTPase HflX [Egibacter rhizosphaerae]
MTDKRSTRTEEPQAPLRRADRRRAAAQRVRDDAPQEGVAIIRRVDRAVLVAVQTPEQNRADVDGALDELALLLDTAGGEAAERLVQRRDHPDGGTFIGRGKIEELRELAAETDADAVVFDDELSPAQQRNLEERLGVKVLDRTIVILDIFAQHAASREGKAQVELAQLSYLLPRLRGWGHALSRLGGGIGTRGPGETQLEVDRRKLNRRIAKLRRDLEDFERTRRLKGAERERQQVPVVALVGYTNAGKSTLLRALSGAELHVADQLFATLDTTVRRVSLSDGREVVATDTVGFVRKLPTQLIEAFKSTLEETLRADLVVHVVDASHPEAQVQIAAVDEVLEEIGAQDMPTLLALNKVDALDAEERRELHRDFPDAVAVSAATGQNVERLLGRVAAALPTPRREVEALVPYAEGQLVAQAHREGEVRKEEHRPEGTYLVVDADRVTADALWPYAFADPWAGERGE